LAKLALAKLQFHTGSFKDAHTLNVEVVEMCDIGITTLLNQTFWKKYTAAISGD
jgi:hypothetical protein